MVPMHLDLKMGPMCPSVCHKIISVYSGYHTKTHTYIHIYTHTHTHSEHKVLFFLMLNLVVHIPTTEL